MGLLDAIRDVTTFCMGPGLSVTAVRKRLTGQQQSASSWARMERARNTKHLSTKSTTTGGYLSPANGKEMSKLIVNEDEHIAILNQEPKSSTVIRKAWKL